jgi:hypothetical protein
MSAATAKVQKIIDDNAVGQSRASSSVATV